MINLEHYPEQYKVNPELGSILDLKEDSRIGVLTALWNYIKVNNLQDKVDRRVVRADEKLKAVSLVYRQISTVYFRKDFSCVFFQLFRLDQLSFQQIPELVNRFLHPPDAIILHYTIKPNEPPPASPQAWDVEVKTEDTSLKSRMNQVILNMNTESARELAKYDEEVCCDLYENNSPS